MFHRVLKYFIKKIGLHKAIEEVQNEENIKKLYSNVLGADCKLYKEARIYNFQNDNSAIKIGSNSHIRGELLVFPYGGKISIGNYTFIGENSRIWSGENIEIGNNILISHNVNIIDSNSHEIDSNERKDGFISLVTKGQSNEKGSIKTAPIVIRDGAWINFNCSILKGVTIGESAIIAAGTIVTTDVPPFCLYGGNPAKVIKHFN